MSTARDKSRITLVIQFESKTRKRAHTTGHPVGACFLGQLSRDVCCVTHIIQPLDSYENTRFLDEPSRESVEEWPRIT